MPLEDDTVDVLSKVWSRLSVGSAFVVVGPVSLFPSSDGFADIY